MGYLLLPMLILSAVSASAAPTQIDVFISGQEDYHTFRIPALIVSKHGTLLAFCEGRKKSRSDTGDIDMVLKRSFDNGETWKPLQVIADFRADTIGNPCPVVDRDTGVIWLPLTKNIGADTQESITNGASKERRTVWMMKSADDGETWSKPVEITKEVSDPKWTWYATGPGCSIQMKSGRLVVPCDHRVLGSKERGSHIFYSDDHGHTWKLGGRVAPDTNECQVVELADGSLQLNMRSFHGKHRRAIATSKDAGLSWSKLSHDEALLEPVCQASLVRYTLAKNGGKNRLLFSNPASKAREKLTIRMSDDDGQTWPVAKLLHEGPAAYSCLAVLPDLSIGCLYERGKKSPYERLTFARFSADWLTD